MTLRAIGQVFGVVAVCTATIASTLHVTKSTAQSAKESQAQAEERIVPRTRHAIVHREDDETDIDEEDERSREPRRSSAPVDGRP